MARRRPEEPDRFAHSPFKSLKGLPVSGPTRPPAVTPVVPEAPVAGGADDGELFAQEMDWLSVRPLPGRRSKAPGRAEPAGQATEAAPVDADAGEFLAAVGRLDKTFKDDLPHLDEKPQARPRRMRQLERGALQPAGQLDLHGLNREDALVRTRTFLAHAVRQQWPVVLIVTGKGLHSGEGPVLRRAVEGLLHDARDLVLEWAEAPRCHGGAGALAVFLRLLPAPS